MVDHAGKLENGLHTWQAGRRALTAAQQQHIRHTAAAYIALPSAMAYDIHTCNIRTSVSGTLNYLHHSNIRMLRQALTRAMKHFGRQKARHSVPERKYSWWEHLCKRGHSFDNSRAPAVERKFSLAEQYRLNLRHHLRIQASYRAIYRTVSTNLRSMTHIHIFFLREIACDTTSLHDNAPRCHGGDPWAPSNATTWQTASRTWRKQQQTKQLPLGLGTPDYEEVLTTESLAKSSS